MEKWIALALLLVTMPGSGITRRQSAAASAPDPNRHLSLLRLSAANADFALRLYRQIATQPGTASKNIFFSPLSISAALSMLSLGAKGNTLTQLIKVLGYSNMTQNGDAALSQLFHYLLQDLTSESHGLHIGNSLHFQKGVNIQKMYVQKVKQYYNAETFSVNFLEPETTKEQINAYLNNKTNGTIQDFLKQPLNRDTVMLLLNFVLFKGSWLKPFRPEHTYEADFHVDDRTTVKVQMMMKTGRFYSIYADHLSSYVIKVPYQGNISLVLILPNPGKLAEVEQNLKIANFQPLLYSLHLTSLSLHLPKLSLKTSYQLNSLMTSMGIVDAFTNHANFSGISEIPLKVSKMIHEAALDIDEKGTVASAVTAVEIMPMSTLLIQKFDRPFLFLIVEHNVKSVLFAGRVMNPKA